jgi:hypothetical protein
MKKGVISVMKLIFSPDDENYNPSTKEIVEFCVFFSLIIISLLFMKWILN